MFLGLMIAMVYLFMLGTAIMRWQRNAILFLLALPPGIYLVFGPR